MIGKIRGILIEIDGQEGLIETSGGVSYRVYLPPQMVSSLPGTSCDIYTYFHVREDRQLLYGFETKQQYDIFLMLLTVDGVGPKTAHTVVGRVGFSELLDAVRTRNIEKLSQVPGLGKKTVQKILLELSNKLKTDIDIASLIEDPVHQEALEALVALGYTRNEGRKLLKGADTQSSIEEQVRFALRQKP